MKPKDSGAAGSLSRRARRSAGMTESLVPSIRLEVSMRRPTRLSPPAPPAGLLVAALLALPLASAAQDERPPDPPPPEERPLPVEEPPPADQPPEPQPEPPVAEGEEAAEDEEAEEAEEGEEEEPKWDVTTPPGPAREVTIDVTEGTWIGLDVSPDGREIVFDLLGDLWTVPIEGGEARALLSDFAWNMQPRYSPDGARIAFTSDRGGGDNVWTIPRGGGEPTQVTSETHRLLNAPAWSPDGEWIAARKHFTSQRSLGAGEIWLYHRSGSKGLQLTEKPNDQKDVGEPAFSPDGRYVYFSQDTTPGPVFEYNKDPNPGIYAVRRLDRETGEVVDWIDDAGGAADPTPSPDGSRVAFVRRVRGATTLWLKDTASGAEWQIHDGLDRDLQETWAIHGVYPDMAWTPDGRSIVFWAGGKIRRIDVGTREVAEIPFHVRATKQLTEALRYPVEVAPDRWPTRMLRWVEVSPDGRQAVYESLGKLWLQDLSGGPARRLTTQDDHFELYPAFTRDGRSVVYVTWDDAELGAVRLAPARAGGTAAGRRVTPEPGHYVEPAATPDGATVVYRKIGGGFLRPEVFGAEPGIYRVPAAGGEPEKVTIRGVEPQFGADPERMYYTVFEGEGDDGPKRELRSIELDGSDERTHLVSLNATEYRVSPDGRWIAWTERYNAYVAPLVPTGKAVEIGPKSEALPVARVSRDAGVYLHWSGDSRTLHWSLGPELFRRDLPEAFSFVEGAPEELPEPPAEGVRLGFEVTSPRPEGTLALVGGRVITLSAEVPLADGVIEDGVVVVRGHRIAAVGRRGEVEIPAGARVVDTTGKTIIPGLVDVHWHGAFGTAEIVPEDNWVAYASLAFGVTTIHDPSNDTSTVFAASELARAGLVVAPRVFSTGTILYGAAGDFKAEIESLEDARSHLRRMKAVGAWSVKSYNQPRRDQRQQVIQAARELEMMVVPEGGSLLQHNLTMVADGHTGIEHSIPVARVYDDVEQFWGASDVGYTPTLVVGYGGLWGEEYWYATTNVWEDERLLTFVPRELVDARSRRRTIAPEAEWGHFHNARTAHQLLDAGVPVQLGAHGQREGLGAHWELWMFEQGGMTPLEALRAATLDGARYLGLDGDVGSIEPGKLADLAVLTGNPLEDIRQSRTVELVVLDGYVYDAATLNRLAPHERERPPFFWERDAVEWLELAREAR